MKNLLIALVAFVTATVSAFSLSPIIVVTNHNSGANLNIKVENVLSGEAYSETITGITPNSSGLLIFIVGKGSQDWAGISESSVTTAQTVDVYDGTTLIAQYRLDYLVDASARAGLIGGDLKVAGNTTFEGDVTVEGKTIINGTLGMESSTFTTRETLGELTTNIMIYTGDGDEVYFSLEDLNENLMDNSHYYIVNNSSENDIIRFARCGECFGEEIGHGKYIIILKAGGNLYILQHPDFQFNQG